jgi:hypothetical protein
VGQVSTGVDNVMRWFSANSPDREIRTNFETDIAFPKGSWHEPFRAVRA